MTQSESQEEVRYKRSGATRALTISALALHAYKLQHGDYPRQLADLMPEFVSTVEDSFSGKPLIYRRTDAGYLLYSVGGDGKDDGGEPIDSSTLLGDIMLDDDGETPYE